MMQKHRDRSVPINGIIGQPFQLKAVVGQSTVLHGLQSLFRRGLLLEGDEAETHGQNLFGSRIFLGRHTCREHLVVICLFLYA